MAKVQSIEPIVADKVNGWLKDYGLDYKLEQESLNKEIDNALNEYYSKNGGTGGNRPDAKLLLEDKNLKKYPILIEYKGYADKLVKLNDNGQVDNRNSKNELIFKNINSYAVNGAVHYANALLHYTSYTDIISIGVSGYAASNRPRKYDKIVNMWFQAFFYSFILTGVLTVIGISDSWATDDMIKCIFPITFNKFWYFTDFFALFFAIPVLNKFLFSISEEVAKKALIIIFVLFSVLGIFNDSFRTAGGYSAIWLIVLYCIGVLAKRVKLFETRKNTTLIILWGLCIFITWLVHDRSGNMQLISYVSPTILLSGMIMVVLFSRLPIKCKFVSKVSPLAFGIYLFQLNQVVWHFMLKDAFVGVLEKPLYIGIPMVFGCASLIFFSGLFVEFIRTILAKICRINLLSKWIVEKLDFVLKKITVILK